MSKARSVPAEGVEPPCMPNIPEFPYEFLSAAAGDHAETKATLNDLNSELAAPAPDRAAIEAHATKLRGFASIAGPFERWWLSPQVQTFIADLTATGI